jgi:hypothetical protein
MEVYRLLFYVYSKIIKNSTQKAKCKILTRESVGAMDGGLEWGTVTAG